MERKVVTVVFADLIGSTALHESLDPESVSRVMEDYHRSVRAPVESHGGTVVQLLGDGVMCAFGVPRVAEDDALRAVRAAVDIQRSFREFVREHSELAGRVGLRVAVNTGEVVVSDDYSAGIGDPLNVAARLQQEAKDGDVLVGEATQRLVAEQVTLARVGSFAIKGRAEPVTAYRVVSLERPAGAATTPFVGRDDEVHRLMAVYDAAVATPAARLAVLLGSPGLGKSRLFDEIARQLEGRATVLTAQCNPAGGATFAPLAEALRVHLRLEAGTALEALRAAIDARVPGDDAERARITSGIGALLAGTPASPEETFFVVRRLLAALAAKQPVVLAIDDLQWAEPLLLDFTEHLVQWGAGVPLLVLAAARPELRDTRSSFTTPGGLISDVVTLGGLDASAAMRLAGSVIGADTLPATVAGRVLTTSEGNPLFLRELVRMLVNDGALRRDGDRWTVAVDLAQLEMPPTIQALLAARIERLRPEERLVLERAAVVGRQFSRAAITHLLPREAHADLDLRLEALRRSELIEADAGWLLGEPALRFHHVLIRDAAYRRVLRGTRAELHARFADWLEARTGESAPHDEAIGWHLEQAHQHLREIGPLDANGRALSERAARHLAGAGRRALARDDLTPAGNLLGRALDCLGDEDPARAELALDWCESLLAAGDVNTAARAIAELGRFTAGSERLRAWHTCFTGQLAALADPKALRASAEAVAAAAATLAAAADVAGESKAHSVHADALVRLGMIGACEAALDRALAAARRGNDRRRANAVLAGVPLAVLWGPSPVTRASGRCLDVVRVLRITQGAPAVEAVALRCQAVLETLRGRSEAARRMIASSRRLVEELGITQRLLEADTFAGLIELLEGDAVAAQRWLRPAYEGFREHGLGVDAARAAALLGRALLAQGRVAAAEALSHESEALAGDDFKAAIAWRGVRAESLARSGEHATAIELARAAVDIASATDDLLDHADARSALAVTLRAAGRSSEADAEEARAVELWEQKGATLLAERARRDVAQVSRADRAPPERVERPRPERRRVRPNAAIAHVRAIEAAVAARDAEAADALIGDNAMSVDHTTGAELDRPQLLRELRSFLSADDFTLANEPLATLGDALALCRQLSSASGVARGNVDVGAYDREEIVLGEVDRDGRSQRTEFFLPRSLGDAIARMYARYAELLPDGSDRVRAAATASSVATVLRELDPDRYDAAFAPDVEFVDHRPLGFPPTSGAEAYLQRHRTLLDLSDHLTLRTDDVLGLRSDVLLVRRATLGTERVGGGAYDRPALMLWVFGADGRLIRNEMFDANRDAEALARFDELTAQPPAMRPVRRRLRPNVATSHAARCDKAIAARDVDAISSLFADESQFIDHTTGVIFDREGQISSLRSLLGARDPFHQLEPLATLGDSLALLRSFMSASTFAGRTLDVGAYEKEEVELVEVDDQGRRRRTDLFRCERLGDTIARLYERYAELLPDGPERTRAAETARTVEALMGPPQRWPFAPDAQATDHRTVGFGSVSGSDVVRAIRTLMDLTEGFATRADDVLALRSDALLVRWTTSGTDRASGGVFERNSLMLGVFGADGLVTRWEQFEADDDAEALARFDELTTEPPAARPVRRRVRPNAATAYAARVDAAVAVGDYDALPPLIADDSELMEHISGATYDRRGQLFSFRALLGARDPTFRQDPLATLGDSLALFRWSRSASGVVGGEWDVGAFEMENVSLVEVDAQGRHVRGEFFALDHLGDAIRRLYERYAELLPDGPERVRAAASASSVVALPLQGPRVPGRLATALAPTVRWDDPRTAGFGTLHGVEAVLRGIDALTDLVEGSVTRVDDILALRSDALLVRWTHSGIERAGGGAVEFQRLQVWIFGADGLVTRWVQLDADHEDEALARFDELTAEPPVPRPTRRGVRANHATAHADRLNAAIAARDAEAVESSTADGMRAVLHPTGAVLDRQEVLGWWRLFFEEDRDGAFRVDPVATLGDSLALCRQSWTGTASAGGAFDVGAYRRDAFALIEGDAEGRIESSEVFAPDRLGDAVVRLYERYAEQLPEGAERARAATTARSMTAGVGPQDLDRFAAAFAPAIEAVDHRTLGTWSARGAEALLEHFRSLLGLADDAANRDDDVLGLRSDAFLVRRTHFGSARAGGGAYERQFIVLLLFGSDGLITRIEWFDTDRDTDALARFDELRQESQFDNAASRGLRRLERCWNERDWEGVAAMFAPGYRIRDRRSLIGLDLEGEEALASVRMSFDVESGRWSSELLATRGERLALFRRRFQAEGVGDIGAFDSGERLSLSETDAEGRRVLQIHFEPGDLDAAYAELDARYAAGEAAPHAHSWDALHRFLSALSTGDWVEVTRRIVPDFVLRDRRRLGLHELRSRDEYVARVRSLAELAPDARIRLEHVLALEARGALCVVREVGNWEGGPFETPFLGLARLGADGRFREFQNYDLDQLDDARASFAELVAAPPTPWVANAATRSLDRVQEAWAARDRERVTAEFAADFHASDRRGTVLLELDRDESLAFTRMNFELTSSRQIYEVLATRGERLALARMRVEGAAGRDAGPFEMEWLTLIEVNEKGERVALIRFDEGDLDAAYAELDERFYTGEAAPFVAVAAGGRAFVAAVAARDWDSLAKLLAPDLVVYDHRRLGWETLHGPALLVDTWKSLVELAPDVRVRIDHAQGSHHGSLAVFSLLGTHEGGDFEDQRIVVHEYDENGKIRQHDIYGLDQLDQARTRFEAIRSRSGAAPS